MGNRFDTQNKLIAATREIIITEGIEATSLEHICKVAGFTRGAFYSNFASKDSLLAALAEDEYTELIERLRETVVTWAQRPQLSDGEGPVLETLLFEALDAIRVNGALYVLHSELLMRSIRDPQWGIRLFDINSQFVDELGKVLEWIIDASGRELTISLRAMTHAIIGIVMRAAGVAAWRVSMNEQRTLMHETLAGNRTGAHSTTDSADKSSGEPSVRDSAAGEILELVLDVLYSSSKPK